MNTPDRRPRTGEDRENDWWGRTGCGGSPYPRLWDADRRRSLERGGAVGGRRRCNCEIAPRRAGRKERSSTRATSGSPVRSCARGPTTWPRRRASPSTKLGPHARAPGRDLDRPADRHPADGRPARRLPDGPERGSRVRRGPRLRRGHRRSSSSHARPMAGLRPGPRLRRRRRHAPPRSGRRRSTAFRCSGTASRPAWPGTAAHQRHRLAGERPRDVSATPASPPRGRSRRPRRRGSQHAPRIQPRSSCLPDAGGTRLAWRTVTMRRPPPTCT